MQQGWCIGRRLLVQLRANNQKEVNDVVSSVSEAIDKVL